MSKGFKIFFGVLISGLIILIIWFKQKDKTIESNEFTEPKISTVINKRYFSGTIVPAKEINLMPQLSGIIEEIYVKNGDKVKIGTKIAKIELIASPVNVERAERAVITAELSLNLNSKEYERSKILFREEYISDSEFEIIENKFVLSKEKLISAKRQLEIAKKGYAKGGKYISNVVTSTVEGVVLDLPLKVGASVIEKNTFGKGSVIAVIADMNDLVFRGKVNEKDLMFFHKGLKFDVSVSALNNKKYETILTNISLKGVNENGVVKFDFEGKLLTNDTDSLPERSGYSGIAEIILKKAENVLTIDEKNIIYRNDSAFVEVLNNKIFEEKYIIPGVSDGIKVEVKKGITINDKIKIQN